ncbi:hypothetical protein KC334_g17139 [Hortaea werneckii]|nr:hypothetical protein KC334_g17139 [Hortaea werneckii]KAI6965502.1 hypothetical protein KC355_g12232 [Hortaea werneckii]
MESKYEMKDEGEMESEPGGLITWVKNLILLPIRPFISKTALRTYLTSILIISTSTLLFIFAITAYILFYYAYVPNLTFSRTLHLQFDAVHTNQIVNRHPYGTATLAPDIITGQAYDVAIELSLPRTPDNIAAGNFMLQVDMLAAAAAGKGTWAATTPEGIISEYAFSLPSATPTTTDPSAPAAPAAAPHLLASSRRSAILPYRSWPVEGLYKLTEIHWYLLNFRSETEVLHVPMFEGIAFPAPNTIRGGRGRKEMMTLPDALRVEVQSSHRLQVYSARAVFRARFRGIRWFMFSHRFLAAGLFIAGFWATEMVFAGVMWVAVAASVYPRLTGREKGEEVRDGDARVVKREDGDEGSRDEEDGKAAVAARLSDTERTFPTLGGKKPLRYSSPRIKREEEDGETEVILPADGTAAPLLADDEEEDDGVDMESFVDSGIGTSLESTAGGRRESIRRRRGRASLMAEEEGRYD